MRQHAAILFVRTVATTATAVLMGLTLSVAAASASNTFYATPTATAMTPPCSQAAPCTLAIAVQAADQAPGANTIVLAGGNYSPTSTLNLTNTSGTITIEGPAPNPTVIGMSANIQGASIMPTFGSIFTIAAGVTADFQDVEVSGGGGQGNAVIDDLGTLAANDLTAEANNGPVQIAQGATGTLTNSTVADAINTGIIDTGTLTLTNSDVIDSGAGGIANSGHILNLVNSIVAGNQATVSTAKDCFAAPHSSTTSIDGDGTCDVGALSGAALNLTSATATITNGGTTPTYAPGSGSPAIGGATRRTARRPTSAASRAPRPAATSAPCRRPR